MACLYSFHNKVTHLDIFKLSAYPHKTKTQFEFKHLTIFAISVIDIKVNCFVFSNLISSPQLISANFVLRILLPTSPCLTKQYL